MASLTVGKSEKSIGVGYQLSENEQAYSVACVPRAVKVWGGRKEPLKQLTAEYVMGDTGTYRDRVLVFDAGTEAHCLRVGRDPLTLRVWRSLTPYGLDESSGGGQEVHPVLDRATATPSSDRTVAPSNTSGDTRHKIQAARSYRAQIETSRCGVLIVRKDEVREKFGGQDIKKNVAQTIEHILETESITVFPRLHQAKDLVILAAQDTGFLKTDPELFRGDDPLAIAQRILEHASQS